MPLTQAPLLSEAARPKRFGALHNHFPFIALGGNLPARRHQLVQSALGPIVQGKAQKDQFSLHSVWILIAVSCGPLHSVWILVVVSCGPLHSVWILLFKCRSRCRIAEHLTHVRVFVHFVTGTLLGFSGSGYFIVSVTGSSTK